MANADKHTPNKGELPPPTPGAAQPTPKQYNKLRVIAGISLLALLSYHVLPHLSAPEAGRRATADPNKRGKLSAKAAEKLFLTVPDIESALQTSKDYATLPHLAGSEQDFVTAKMVLKLFQDEFGIDKSVSGELPVYEAGSAESQAATHSITSLKSPAAWIDEYYPVMNTPLGRALDIVDENGTAIWKANVEEVLDEEGDPAGKYASAVGAWHGLSKDGNVTGKVVYVNYGRKADFDALVAAGTNFTGTIALARYGGVFRGLKVKAAAEAGAVGCLIYSDPRDDGEVTVANGYKPYPDGPARPPTSVQRGSVQYLSSYPGDPTTPGYPAYKNASRVEGGNVPTIPSLPISWANAERLLAEISETAPFELNGAHSARSIRLVNHVNTTVTPIWNTIGVIPGHITDEVVFMGNHRDAWVNGAADPTSGTVAVNEVVRGFGKLLKEGWRPLRTIVIASWDAEEYGLIGSTEYGEDFAEWLSTHVVSYLNLDVATGGSRFHLGGSPSLAHLIRGVAQEIAHPTDANRTLWDARADKGPFTGPADGFVDVSELSVDHLAVMQEEKEMAEDPRKTGVSPLGSGSDYTVFLQRLGIASIDGAFGGTYTDAVYLYHSAFDSHQWQERYADPGFVRHVAVAKYLGLVALRMADSIILPINTTQYAVELGSYLEKVEKIASTLNLLPEPDFHSLRKSIHRLQHASIHLDHTKHKAEKALRRALKHFDDKKKKKATLTTLHSCTTRRFQKARKFVKRVFGVEEPRAELESRHKRRGAVVDLQKVRLGKAAAGWSKRSEENVERSPVDLSKVHIGRPGAYRRSVEEEDENDSEDEVSDVGLWEAMAMASAADADVDADADAVPRHVRKLIKAARAVRTANSKLRRFEQGFIAEEGIKDRRWYRHKGVAPGKWLGYGATTFPALTEALEDDKNSTLASGEADRLAFLINSLSHTLRK